MPRPSSPLKTSPQKIAQLYLAGHAVNSVAALTKVPVHVVRRVLIQLGVPRRPRGAPKGSIRAGKLTVEQREQLRADLRSGQFPSMRAIAHKYGVTRERVRQYAAAAGITRYNLAAVVRARSKRRCQREAARDAARHAARDFRETIREVQRKTVVSLWQSGVLLREITRIVGFKSASSVTTLICEYRKSFPTEVPYRTAKKCTPQEARERERAQAARAAAQRKRIEMRHVRLAELWKIGATKPEIASVLGVSVVAVRAMIQLHRRRTPADFPHRAPLNR